MKSNSCLLLFGGAFNPMHEGHILHVEAVEEQLKKKYEDVKVCISVSKTKHFEDIELISIDKRLGAVKEVCLDHNNWFAIEEKTNYSIDTVKYLKSYLFDLPIYLLIGTDQAKQFDMWNRSNELLDLIEELAIFDKESGQFTIGEEKFFTTHFLNISSTEIRNMVKSGVETVKIFPLVPDPSLKLLKYYV